jgi:hypothetical protein
MIEANRTKNALAHKASLVAGTRTARAPEATAARRRDLVEEKFSYSRKAGVADRSAATTALIHLPARLARGQVHRQAQHEPEHEVDGVHCRLEVIRSKLEHDAEQ